MVILVTLLHTGDKAAETAISGVHKLLRTGEVPSNEPVWPSGKAAGKQKGIGSIPLRLSFLFRKVVVCGHCLVMLSITSY